MVNEEQEVRIYHDDDGPVFEIGGTKIEGVCSYKLTHTGQEYARIILDIECPKLIFGRREVGDK